MAAGTFGRPLNIFAQLCAQTFRTCVHGSAKCLRTQLAGYQSSRQHKVLVGGAHPTLRLRT